MLVGFTLGGLGPKNNKFNTTQGMHFYYLFRAIECVALCAICTGQASTYHL